MAGAGRHAGSRVNKIRNLSNEVSVYRTYYFEAGSQDRLVTHDFLQKFHGRVMEYYTALRVYRSNKEVKGMWHEVDVVDETDGVAVVGETLQPVRIDIPEQVEGLDKLGFYITAETTVKRSLSRSNGASRQTTVPVILSGSALVRASGFLDEVANQLNMIDQPNTEGRDEDNLPEIDPGKL